MKLYLPIVFALLFTACELINPEEDTPSYIYIDSFEVETSNLQGSHSSKITDAWVWVDNENLGVYPLPAYIPVLKSGVQDIHIEAGIKQNGISASRINYPFYTPYSKAITLSPLKTDTISPLVTYSIDEMPFMIDFEGIGINLEITSDSLNQQIEKENTLTENRDILGYRYGKVVLEGNDDQVFECTTPELNIPTDRPVYLEMDYKCNNTLVVGLYANSTTQVDKEAIIYLNPKEEWNKLYLSLSNYIVSYNNVNNYKVFFGMFKEADTTQSEFCLDNVKILYSEE